jgi:ElaB/YqjD/DUF883 family membrane-anchored ribosome-binding protein
VVATGPNGCSLHCSGASETETKRKTKNMENSTQESSSDLGTLAEDARALISATADVGGEKVGEARKRLAAALERAKALAGRVRERAVAGAKAADEAVHEHPYHAMAIAFGLGAIIGYLVARRGSSKND